MKKSRTSNILVALCVLVCIPRIAAAQVVISEIMYDLQSGSDSGREWVEVFNAGASSVHFTDWKFYEANTNHGITAVQGGETLASGAYAIIADDPTKFLADHPGYSGQLFDSAFSLGNTGEMLAIHMPSPDFTESDSVSYQSSWGASGDGNTLQRASVSGTSFSAAAPTPGTGTLTASQSASTETSNTGSTSDTQQTTQTTNASTQTSSYVAPPVAQIFVDAGSDRTVIVGADTIFDARAYNRDQEVLASEHIRFLWTFGDGTTAEGSSVQHHFSYPGRYVVVAYIAENKSAGDARIVVTAEPAKMSFLLLPDGGVGIRNESGHDLDLSGWIIKQYERLFILPEHSIILAGATMRISHETLGYFSATSAELEYPNGMFAFRPMQDVATTTPNVPNVPVIAPVPQQVTPVKIISHAPAQNTTKPSEVIHSETQSEPTSTESAPAPAPASQLIGPALAVPANLGWWFGAASISVIGAGAAALARSRRKNEWDIVEEVGD